MYSHHLKGKHQLEDAQIKTIARYILFLHSDLDYEWEYVDMTNPFIRSTFSDFLINIMSFGKHYRDLRKQHEEAYEKMKLSGDFELWPFKSRTSYEAELKRQPYLQGQDLEII